MLSADQSKLWAVGASAGDRLALAKLLALYHPTLAARAAARLDPALRARTSVEDVVQDVYLQVFRQIDRFEPRGPGSFLNWVLTILDHKLVDTHRLAHREQRDVARESPPLAAAGAQSYWHLLDQVYMDSATPSRIARRDESVGALLACLSGLPEGQRRVIELRFLGGLPLAEVARRLDRSEDAVVALTQRALKALRESMDHLGDFTRGD